MAINPVFLSWTQGNEMTPRTYNTFAPVIIGDDPYTQIATETISYDGYKAQSSDEIKSAARSFLAQASRELRVNVTATRQDGGTWQISVTYTTYRKNEEIEEAEEREFPEGEREDAPSYQCSESRVDVPRPTHPRYAPLFANPNSPVAVALAALYNGALGGELVPDPNTEGGYLGTADAIIDASGDDKAKELAAMFVKGQRDYASYQTMLTCSFKTATYNLARSSKMGKIANPPGPYQTPPNKNWLCIGVDTQPIIAEGCFSVSEKYLLSDAGGWDTNIYALA